MDWPHLPLDSWRDTYETLHRWLQIVGKIQLARTPRTNHFWNVAFQVTARGLASPAIPRDGGSFTFDMDFVDHQLVVKTSEGAVRSLSFQPRTVAAFEREVFSMLESLGIRVEIWDQPVELQSEAIPFSEDRVHGAYDPEAVQRWWRIVARSAAVFERFRAGYVGKASPVHFFWGSFDLAVSRYSGRRAPARQGAGIIEAEAYSHEVSSVGFWPGDARFPEPAYFAYCVPKPAGLEHASIRPEGAFWHEGLGEFVLPYDVVRQAASPADTLLAFCESTYAAGADLGGWDRAALEREAFRPPAVERPADDLPSHP